MMKLRGMILGAALMLAGGLSVLSAGDIEDAEATKKAAEAIKKLADDAGTKDWTEFSKASAEVAKKHELDKVMNGFKMRKPNMKGIAGIGVGDKANTVTPDGIEAKIISMTKNPMAAATLNKQQADLIRMAEITAAIAATATHQCPVEKKLGDKDPADWKTWSKDMYESSQDLLKALKAKDAKQAKTAAFKLNKTCTDCHAVFR